MSLLVVIFLLMFSKPSSQLAIPPGENYEIKNLDLATFKLFGKKDGELTFILQTPSSDSGSESEVADSKLILSGKNEKSDESGTSIVDNDESNNLNATWNRKTSKEAKNLIIFSLLMLIGLLLTGLYLSYHNCICATSEYSSHQNPTNLDASNSNISNFIRRDSTETEGRRESSINGSIVVPETIIDSPPSYDEIDIETQNLDTPSILPSYREIM